MRCATVAYLYICLSLTKFAYYICLHLSEFVYIQALFTTHHALFAEIIPFAKEKTALDIKEIEIHFKEGVEDNHKCLRELLSKRNCSYNCNILSFGQFPPCKTVAQQDCMWEDMYAGQAGQDYLNWCS